MHVLAQSWVTKYAKQISTHSKEKEKKTQPARVTNIHINNILLMSDKIKFSLHTLPVELVYRILDHLHEITILCSMRNVCTRINAITDSYHRYQVNYNLFIYCFRFIQIFSQKLFINLLIWNKIDAYWTKYFLRDDDFETTEIFR